MFDEIRKILNEENVFIEDFFQTAFERLYVKFLEENSESDSEKASKKSTSEFFISEKETRNSKVPFSTLDLNKV